MAAHFVEQHLPAFFFTINGPSAAEKKEEILCTREGFFIQNFPFMILFNVYLDILGLK
jgi:hypothetical protein